MVEQSLKSKTVKGLGWSAADNIIKIGITFVVSIILARLLCPDEYGLIGILTIFISVFNFIVDSGFTNALIRKQNATEKDYSTVFYTNLVVSIFMALALFFCAKPISRFFEREELVALTQVMSCIVVINALCIVQKARTTKAIDFKTQTKVTAIASITSGVIGISMAFMGYGVWALVGQQISAQLLTTTFFWIFNRWIPKLIFSWDSFKEMWSFGWKLLVSGLIDTTWKEIYQVVIGKCYAPVTLGLYTRAKQFSDLCSSNLTTVIQRVSYPVLSSIQDDKTRLKTAYKRVIRTTMLPTFVLMLGMAACAKPMILCLIGEKWVECVPMLQIICTFGMLYPLHAINLNMLQVQGRTDLFLKLEIIKKIIAIGPLLLGVFVGINWMLVGSFFSSVISYYFNAYYSGPFLNYSIKEQIEDILPSLRVALTMAIPVYAMSFLSINHFILLPLQIMIGAIIVISICETTKLPEYLEIKSIAMPAVNKIIRKNK
ncbi:lipopolysaccharide biosynthesis protein [Prevotella copri]|uniref:Lipopolysaccharide biosynthesis protein n=1 Tax=Segatella copri TaxID=165179 RepID=A0A6I2U4N8_9BACT|nr:lipopolysaccharide biosynthesis protein [Segatella copri]MST78749.1 lipopolysaccharide biosynthesis protein [Segatella copri]